MSLEFESESTQRRLEAHADAYQNLIDLKLFIVKELEKARKMKQSHYWDGVKDGLNIVLGKL